MICCRDVSEDDESYIDEVKILRIPTTVFFCDAAFNSPQPSVRDIGPLLKWPTAADLIHIYFFAIIIFLAFWNTARNISNRKDPTDSRSDQEGEWSRTHV